MRSAPAVRRIRVGAIVESFERRLLMAATTVPYARINFQPASAAVPAEYVADPGDVFSARGNGLTYGWDADNGAQARDRNSAASPDQRYDTLTHTQLYGSRTWELSVPSGTYNVRLVAGDAHHANSVYAFDVEGTAALSGTPTAASLWVEGALTVEVTDGRLTVTNAAGASNNKLCFVDVDRIENEPVVTAVPGTIQAEDYDEGGPNVGYVDTTPANLGGAYRNDAVDIQAIGDTGGGYAVGWTRPTELLRYTVDVAATGWYALDLRVACGGSGGTFHVEVDGVDRTGPMTLANTGGWAVWKTLAGPAIELTQGRHVLKLAFDRSAVPDRDIGNVNWLKLTSVKGPTVIANDASASEVGPATGQFTFARGGGSAAFPLTIHYAVNGTATSGTDYNAIPTSVSIPAGAASATVTITPKSDALPEGPESVKVTLSGGGSASVHIADRDIKWPVAWRLATPAPLGRWESGAALVDGKIYVFGGWIQGSTVGTQRVHAYDVAADRWEELAPAPIPHTHAAFAVDAATKSIYFAGGLYGDYPGTITDRVFRFDTVTRTWTELNRLPAPRAAGALAVVGRKLYYFSGNLTDRVTNVGDHYVLNLDGGAAAQWATLAPLPMARDHLSSVVLGGKIYAIGGEFGHDRDFDHQPLVHRYDPATNQWTRLADLPLAKSHMESAVFVHDGRIVAAGGFPASSSGVKSTDNVVVYDPPTNKWLTLPPLPVPLRGAVVQRVGSRVVITTGSSTNVPGTTTWVGDLF